MGKSNTLPSGPTWEIAHLFPTQGHWSEEEYLALETNRRIDENLVLINERFTRVENILMDHSRILQDHSRILEALAEDVGQDRVDAVIDRLRRKSYDHD